MYLYIVISDHSLLTFMYCDTIVVMGDPLLLWQRGKLGN